MNMSGIFVGWFAAMGIYIFFKLLIKIISRFDTLEDLNKYEGFK
jgi:hypothetical protein